MVINNWPVVKEIIKRGIKENASKAVIGVSILDTQQDLTVLKINDVYVLADREGTHGRFNTPEDAWVHLAKICMREWVYELDRNSKNK